MLESIREAVKAQIPNRLRLDGGRSNRRQAVMSAERDYYAILGVREEAEGIAIRAAYRSKMRECHPDLNTSTAAALRARLVNEAYRVLRDRELRLAYDRGRRRGLERSGSALKFAPPVGSGVATLCEIDLARPAVPLRRRAWFPFTVFVLAVAGSFSALLASGILDTTPIHFPDFRRGAGRREQELLPFPLDPLAIERGPAKLPLEQREINSLKSPSSPDLGDAVQLLPAILTTDVAEGVGRFAQVSLQAGISGAQQYSVYCHKQAALLGSWHGADRCAAFDITAAYVDADVARSTRSPQSRYFSSQLRKPGPSYAPLGVPEVVAELRMSQIRDVILPMISPNEHARESGGHVKTLGRSAMASEGLNEAR